MANREEKGCQTDEDLIYNYAWTKFYYHFQNNASGQTASKQEVSIPDVEMTDGSAKTEANTAATTAVSERLDADAIKKIAEESLEARGFMYEPSTGLYYDTQNDLFYDQETQLYLDIVNRINYKFVLNERTNTYQLRYDSKMNRAECKRLRSYLKRSDLFEVDESKSSSTVTTKETTQGDKEEGEESASISSSSSSSSSSKRRRHRHKSKKSKKLKKHKSKKKKKKSSDNKSGESEEDEIEIEDEKEEDEEEEIIDLANQYPPCIRAILIEYDQDDEDDEIKLGSLFIVPYTGGTIGKASKCIVSFPKLKEIENEHVTIEYDTKKKIYFIKDLNSKLGTFINKTKIEADRIVEIKHGDEVNLSDVVTLLIHIHWGSNSCPNCEPGEVMSRFKQEKERLEREMNLLNLTREEARKETLKSIKKKYGLKFNDFDKPTVSNQGYKDRAAERRNQLGVDTNTNQATTSKASVHVAIGESNVGHKMLQKMGWKQGQGLGKKEEGITEPISTNVKLDNSGLGSNANTQCSMDMDERQKRKIIALKKTQERYQSSN